MLLVETHLNRTSALSLIDGLAHRVGNGIGIHDDLAVRVARGASDRLNKRATIAQEALFIRIENRHERNLRQVKTLAQQVDAHENIDFSLA